MNYLKCVLIVLAGALLINFTVPYLLGVGSNVKMKGLFEFIIFLSIFEALTLGYIQYIIFYRNQKIN